MLECLAEPFKNGEYIIHGIKSRDELLALYDIQQTLRIGATHAEQKQASKKCDN